MAAGAGTSIGVGGGGEVDVTVCGTIGTVVEVGGGDVGTGVEVGSAAAGADVVVAATATGTVGMEVDGGLGIRASVMGESASVQDNPINSNRGKTTTIATLFNITSKRPQKTDRYKQSGLVCLATGSFNP